MSHSPKSPPPLRHGRTGRSGTRCFATRALRRAAVVTLATGTGAMAAFVVPSVEVDALAMPTTNHTAAQEAEPESHVEALIEAHDCWSDRATMPPDMEGRNPGHVIVTAPAHDHATYSSRLVGAALEEVFGTHRTPGMTVHAFCR